MADKILQLVVDWCTQHCCVNENSLAVESKLRINISSNFLSPESARLFKQILLLGRKARIFISIQGVPRGNISILGGHSIGHYKQKMYMYMYPFPNGFRDRGISLCSTLYRRATRHVLARVAKYIDADGGIFENVLY
jgi:hypothetical protein